MTAEEITNWEPLIQALKEGKLQHSSDPSKGFWIEVTQIYFDRPIQHYRKKPKITRCWAVVDKNGSLFSWDKPTNTKGVLNLVVIPDTAKQDLETLTNFLVNADCYIPTSTFQAINNLVELLTPE